MASGADLAPRAWRLAVTPRTPEPSVAQGMNALMVARVLRPSYGWQLASKAGAYLPQRRLAVNEAEQLERLQALPAYQSALLRHQYDAEACLSRVLIRTGKRLDQLQGEDLLFYADVVRTSGRNRASTWHGSCWSRSARSRESRSRCGRRGRPRATPASTRSRPWSTATASRPAECATCWSTTCTSSNRRWTTAAWRAGPTGWCGCSGGRSCRSTPCRPICGWHPRSRLNGANDCR